MFNRGPGILRLVVVAGIMLVPLLPRWPTVSPCEVFEGNVKDYPWPGNFRGLGRCVRNVMIRGSYRPLVSPCGQVGGLGPVDELLDDVRTVKLTAEQLRGCYYALDT